MARRAVRYLYMCKIYIFVVDYLSSSSLVCQYMGIAVFHVLCSRHSLVPPLVSTLVSRALQLMFLKVGMLQCCTTGNTSIRIVLEELGKQVRSLHTSECLHRHKVRNGSLSPLGKFRIKVRQSTHVGPQVIVGCAATLKNLEQLINIAPTREQRHACCHFGKDTSDTPRVDRSRVTGGAQ